MVGTALLWWSLRLEPGNPLFYLGSSALAATWVLGPSVTEAECDHLEQSTKAMCTNLDDRLACADDFQL